MRKPKMSPPRDGYGTTHTVRIPLWPYLVAPLACMAAFPVAWLINRFFGRGVDAGWTGFSLALASVGLILFVAVASRPRGMVMRWMATGNTVMGFAWFVPAVLSGPTSKAMIGMWLLGTMVMSIACAVYRIMRQARGDDDARNGSILQGEFGELGDAVKQLRGVKFARPVINGAKVSTVIEALPGETFSTIAGARAEIASLLDVPATAVRTIADADSERRGRFEVVPVDQLRDPIPDPGPSAPGGSIALPIVLGRAEDGSDAGVILPGDPKRHRNAVGMFGVVGMSGSGKTELLLRLCKEVATRTDADLFIADARKAGQLPDWLKRVAKRVAAGFDEAADLIDTLGERVSARSEELGRRGFKQWEQGCGLQFEVVVIFEASAVIAGDKAIVDLAESVRSVGICLIVELQRATYDRIPTSARSNITTWVVLGVEGEEDAQAALSDETVAAGACPWRWKNGKPGYFYLEWAGRGSELWSAPCRSFIEDDDKRAADVAAARGAMRPAAAAVVPSGPAGGQSGGDSDEDREGTGVPAGVDPADPPDDVDPDESIAPPPDMPRIPFGERRKMPTGDALLLLRSHVFDLSEAGCEVVRPGDLADVLAQTGLSASWLYGALRHLSTGEDAPLQKTDRGVFRIRAVQPA